MTLNDMITRRRSVRKYDQRPLDAATLSDILSFCSRARPLDADIRMQVKLVSKGYS